MEAVGHADGDLDPVVERLEPGAGAARFDGAWDVGAASPDFFWKARRSRGCGYARPGTPTDNFERFGGSSPFVRGQRMVELK